MINSKKPWFWRRWLLQGLVVTLPIVLTATVLQWAVIKADALLSFFIPTTLQFPGIGIIVVVFGLIGIGALTESVIIQKCILLLQWLIGKVPIIRTIYSTVTKTVSSVLGNDSKFSQVVMLDYLKPGIYSIGFITSQTTESLCGNSDMVNVFLPMSPFLTSGYYVMVPKNQLKVLNITIQEGIQLIISMGIVTKHA